MMSASVWRRNDESSGKNRVFDSVRQRYSKYRSKSQRISSKTKGTQGFKWFDPSKWKREGVLTGGEERLEGEARRKRTWNSPWFGKTDEPLLMLGI